jgi:hypothetical protein
MASDDKDFVTSRVLIRGKGCKISVRSTLNLGFGLFCLPLGLAVYVDSMPATSASLQAMRGAEFRRREKSSSPGRRLYGLRRRHLVAWLRPVAFTEIPLALSSSGRPVAARRARRKFS